MMVKGLQSLFSFFKNPYVLLLLYVVLAVWAVALAEFNGSGHNNFLIYNGVAQHFFAEQPLYIHYPAQYDDVNHYGAFFAFIIYPFSLMPHLLGVLLWVTLSAVLLWCAIRMLPISLTNSTIILLITTLELYNAAAYQQFNIFTAALIILSFSMIERKNEGWAAFLIVVGTFVKLYGVVGLAFCLFIEPRRMPRFWLYLVLWTVVLLGVQFVVVDWDYLVAQYGAWGQDLSLKDLQNQLMSHQNRGLLGMIRKLSGEIHYSDWAIVGAGLALFAVPYLRIKQYRNTGFRLMTLASTLLFLVLFSSGTETSSYITAMLGVGIWWVAWPGRRGWVSWALLLFAVFGALANVMLPADVYTGVFFAYALKALPFTLVWLRVLYEQYFSDFTPIARPTVDLTTADVDVVLPCYNPSESWVQETATHFKALQQSCAEHKMRLFVANDGSKLNFDNQHIEQLRQAIDGVVVVDNKVNRGKGAAVRSGVALTTAPLVVYTDIDFPYEIRSIKSVVDRLSMGDTDIVVAQRNNTYHSELSVVRRALSGISRTLNQLVLGMRFNDAQGGLKGFNGRGRELFLATRINHFLFDTEFIYQASKQNDVILSQVEADLRAGINLPPMSKKTMRREAVNFLRIILHG